MKFFKNLFSLLSICAFLIALSMFISAVNSRGARTVAQGDVASRQDPQSELAGSYDKFLVRSEGDSVCVYSMPDEVYVGTMDVKVNDLPEKDRELLETGIVVDGQQGLLALMEDYTG